MSAWKLIVSGCVAAVVVTGCAAPSRFTWGNYENALYAYAKSPDMRDDYRAALQDAVETGLAQQTLAPGLLAELGYLSLEDGDGAQAISYFEQEMQHFPESRPLLTRIISGLNGGQPINEANVTEATS